MHRIRTTAIASAVLAAFGGQAQAQTNEQLLKELEALKKEVQQLKAQVNAAPPPAAASAPAQPGQPGQPQWGDVATKNDIDGLRSDLENYKYEQTRNRERKTALTTRGTTIGGSVQVRYTTQDQNTSAGSTATALPRRNSFDISSAQLNFAGSLYRDYAEGRNLDYRFSLQYQTNSPANNSSQFNLQDAYLRYSFFPTRTGAEEPILNLTAGQQQIPFGLEAQVGEELRPVIQSAQFLSTLGVGTRQIGLILRGDYEPYVDYTSNYRAPLFEYALGFVNGSGPNKSDDNNHKDLVARGAFTLPVDYNSIFRELKFGLSYYKGKKTLAAGTPPVSADRDSSRTGFDIYYNHTPFGITYEYARGSDDDFAGLKVKSVGQYVTLYYTWGEQFVASSKTVAKYDDWWPKSYQLFARYDVWDPNKDIGNNSTKVATLGFNLFFAETTKLQINLQQTRFDDSSQDKVNALLAQFQYGF